MKVSAKYFGLAVGP